MDKEIINKIGEYMAFTAFVVLFVNIMAGGLFVLILTMRAILKVLSA